MYGSELILDLHGCDVNLFTASKFKEFCVRVCQLIDVRPIEFHATVSEPGDGTDDNPKTHGISAVQFLVESSITMHGLDLVGSAYINVFSCKSFSHKSLTRFVVEWFRAQSHKAQLILRGEY